MTTIREEAAWWLADLIGYEYMEYKFYSWEILEMLRSGIWYKKIETPKKDGTVRICHNPNWKLKRLQQAILKKIFYKLPVIGNLYGFVPQVQMKSGAKKHLKQGSTGFFRGKPYTNENSISSWLLKLDLENFFPSIKANTIRSMFEDVLTGIVYERGFENPEVFFEFCRILTKLTTYKGGLLQGAPTSPCIANLVISWSSIMDDFEELCANPKHPQLSRPHSTYVDDFSISSNQKPSIRKAIRCLEKRKIIGVNPKKTKLNHLRHKAHKITGISFSHKIGLFDEPSDVRTTLPQKKQKFYRGRIAAANRLLREGHAPTNAENGFSLEQIKGYIIWINHVCEEHIPSRLRKVILEFEELTRGRTL